VITTYTTRQPLPHLVEIGRQSLLAGPVYYAGAAVQPDSTVLTVYDEANTVVPTSAVSYAFGIAIATVAAATTSARSPSSRWRVEWVHTLSAEEISFRDECYLVRHRLRPTITDDDIAARLPILDTDAAGRLTTAATYQDQIEEADIEVQSRLITEGRRPNLIVSPSALREAWLTKTIAIIFDGLSAASGDVGDPYAAKAAEWERKFEAAYSRARAAFDWDDDGVADVGGRVGPRAGVHWLC
jgi:hypothetical protein